MERENLLFGVWFECCIDCTSQILSVKMPKEFSFFRYLGFRFPRSGKTALQPCRMFVKLHCTITEPRNSLAQVDRFGYTWRSSWCFWRSRVLIKQCAQILQSENTIPSPSEGNFWNSFQNLELVFSRLMRFFSPQVYSVFPLKCASFGACDFLIYDLCIAVRPWVHAMKACESSWCQQQLGWWWISWRRNYESCPWANTHFYLYGFESVCSFSELICLHCYCTQMLCLPFWFDSVKDTQWTCGILAPSRKAAVLVTGKALANWKMVVCWWSATLVCQHTLQHLGCSMQQTI